MPPGNPPPPQTPFRQWLQTRGLKHAWVATQLGYTPEYFSRVVTGRTPLTAEFRQRCRDRLSVPEAVWRNDSAT